MPEKRMFRMLVEFHPPEGSYEPIDLFANIDGPWTDHGSMLLSAEDPIGEVHAQMQPPEDGGYPWGTRVMLVPQFDDVSEQLPHTGYEPLTFPLATQAEDLGVAQ